MRKYHITLFDSITESFVKDIEITEEEYDELVGLDAELGEYPFDAFVGITEEKIDE